MANFIQVRSGALSAALCQEVIERFEESHAKAPGVAGFGVDIEKKLSVDLVISGRPEWLQIVSRIKESVDKAIVEYVRCFPSLVIGALSPTVIDPEKKELVVLTHDNWERLGSIYVSALVRRAYCTGDIVVQKYVRNVGGYPHWHSEVFPEPSGSNALRRVLFWIAYLNDVAEGGETDFLHQRLQIPPNTGQLLIAPAAFTHTHRGNRPRSGHKYIVTSSLLFRSPDELFGKVAASNS